VARQSREGRDFKKSSKKNTWMGLSVPHDLPAIFFNSKELLLCEEKRKGWNENQKAKKKKKRKEIGVFFQNLSI
jgi:hypothetical protein